MNDAGETRLDPDGAPLAAALSRLRAARHDADGAAVEEPDADETPLFVPAWLERSVPVALPLRRAEPDPGLPEWPSLRLDETATGDPESDAVGQRLSDRRTTTAAARQAAIAYAALNGHVPGAAEDELDRTEGRRWALRPRTALAGVTAVLLLAVVAAVTFLWPHADATTALTDLGVAGGAGVTDGAATGDFAAGDSAAGDSAAGGSVEVAPSPVPSALLVVAVVGHVNSPGVVTLPEGSRVFDAVAAAGGATGDADLAAINLARLVADGEQITVPAPGEVVAEGGAGTGGADTGGSGSAGAAASAGNGLIDINTADPVTLDALPGIGPALAARIVEWRTANGPFASVDELDEVSGIGPALLAKVRDLVTV